MSPHHPVFSRFERWKGPDLAGFDLDFLGVRTRRDFFAHESKRAGTSAVRDYPPLPTFDEEYFEWIDVLEAVEAAQGSFTMVELGAGWGRWLARGAAAARQRGLQFLLVGVEGEPTHFRWLKQHLADNSIDAASTRLVEGAIAAKDGWVRFYVGDPTTWYGQAIDPAAPDVVPELAIRERLSPKVYATLGRRKPRIMLVRAISVRRILERLRSPVDLMDLDVQGVEAEALEPAADLLVAKVRRVHIGTHTAENEKRLRELFGGLGWLKINDYSVASTAVTPFGEVSFQDGVQSWINPEPADRITRT